MKIGGFYRKMADWGARKESCPIPGKSSRLTVREIAIFGMLGAIMYASKLLLEIAPNIHLLGVFIVSFTVVYRQKALFPIYLYVLLNGIFSGFAVWWIPYLYIWTCLWGAVMLLPANIPRRIRPLVYMSVCALHGFLDRKSVV